jgi:hypothetical protein
VNCTGSGTAPSNDRVSRPYKEFHGLPSKLDIDSGSHLPAWPKYRQVSLCARDRFFKNSRKTNTKFQYKTMYYLGVTGLTSSSYKCMTIPLVHQSSICVLYLQYVCTVCTVYMYCMYSIYVLYVQYICTVCTVYVYSIYSIYVLYVQ